MSGKIVTYVGVAAGIATILGFGVTGYQTYRQSTPPGIIVQTPHTTDPVELLHARGYSFERDDFYRAIRNSDIETIKLFCATSPQGWISFMDLAVFKLSNAVRENLIACQSNSGIFDCTIPKDYRLAYFKEFQADSILYQDSQNGNLFPICGEDLLRKIRNINDT